MIGAEILQYLIYRQCIMKPRKGLHLAFLTILFFIGSEANAIAKYQGTAETFSIADSFFQLYVENDYKYEYMQVQTERGQFKFKAQFCHDAVIGLSKTPGDVDAIIFEVILGSQRGITNYVRDARDDSTITEYQGTVLDCNSYKDFWISWKADKYEVGTGTVVGSSMIMEWTDASVDIHAVSLATHPDDIGHYRVMADAGRVWEAATLEKQDFGQLWLADYDRPFFRFQVKSCGSAEILLAPVLNDKSNSIHIILGDDNGQRSKILNGENGPVMGEVESPDVLSCDHLRHFWISWMNDYLEVGRGFTLGNDRLVFADDIRSVKNVNALSFTSNTGGKGYWEFNAVRSEYITVWTEPDDSLTSNLVSPLGTLYTWGLRSCSRAVIAMSGTPGDLTRDGYRLEIGANGNTQTILYHQQSSSSRTPVKTESTPNVLDCDMYRGFYIDLSNFDTFVVGTYSSSGERIELLSYSDATTNFRLMIALSLSSENTDAKAEWILNPLYYSFVEVATPGDDFHNHVWYDMSTSHSVLMTVRACETALISMGAYHGIFDAMSYELEIGIDDNNDVLLRKSGTTLSKVEKMLLKLSCNGAYPFWIRWRGRSSEQRISMGEGHVIGDRTLVELDDPNPTPIRILSATTPNALVGNWMYAPEPDNTYILSTKPVKQYKYGFFTTQQTMFTFEVMACSDAHILLHSSADNTVGGRYEVTIGGGQNRYSLIQNLENPSEETQAQTPNILDCALPRFFWIFWNEQSITLGGMGTHIYLTHQTTAPPDISFVSVSTGEAVSGTFAFMKYHHGAANFNIERDNTVGRFQQIWMTQMSQDFIVFGVQSCGGASVVLATYYGLYQADSYEIVFGSDQNTKTKIIWTASNGYEKSSNTEKILDCMEMRDFWISWRNRMVEVGYGRVVGDQYIMSMAMEGKSVHAVSFASGSTDPSIWEVLTHESDVFLARTGTSASGLASVHTANQQFSFSVMACSDVVVQLQQYANEMYEVRIADSNAQGKSAIYKRTTNKFEVDMPNLLDCVPKLFWLTWNNRQIRVGTGSLLRNIFLEWTDSDTDQFTDEISQVQMMTANGAEGNWVISRLSGNLTHFESRSTAKKDYSNFQLTVANRNFIVFRVRACQEAAIAMSQYAGILSDRTIEVVLVNGESRIHDGVDGEVLKQRPTADILSCDTYAPFWLSWEGGEIRVGKGVIIGDILLMQVDFPDTFNRVHGLAVSTDETNYGYWEFGNRMIPNLYQIHTSWLSLQQYQVMWLTTPRSYVQFYVKACADAYIALTYRPYDALHSTYEVQLGGPDNEYCAINYVDINGDKTEKEKFVTTDVLSCDETRSFWISWDNLRLDVGTGDVNTAKLFSLGETLQHGINSVSITTGPTVAGTWEFVENEDDYISVTTPGLHRFIDFSMAVPHRSHLVFKIRACMEVYALMGSTFNNAHSDAYEIGIGTIQNTVCQIREISDRDSKAEENTPDVLSCTDYRVFWVSWSQGKVMLGRGADVFWNHIVEWQDPEPKNIQQVYFDTSDRTNGGFELFTHDGNVYKLRTIKDHTYDFFWMKPWHTHFYFKVAACNDAFIALTSETDKNTILYEIVLGAGGNTQTYIRTESMGSPVEWENTPNILSCSQRRSFWVGWKDGLIEVGVGTAVHENRFIHWQDPNPKTIGMLTLSSGWEASGDWEFTEVQGRDFELAPSTAPKFGDVWRTALGLTSILLKVQARSDVYIILCAIPRLTVSNCYEVQIGIQANSFSQIIKKDDWTYGLETPNILSDTSMSSFWVSWYDQRIMVGRGDVVGQNVFLSAEEQSKFYELNAISFSSMFGVDAKFEFPRDTSVSTATPTTQPSTQSTPPPGFTTTKGGSILTTATQTPVPTVGVPDAPGGMSAGAVVGIIFGSLIMVILLIFLILVVYYRKNNLPSPFQNYNRFGQTPNGDFNSGFDNPNFGVQMSEGTTTTSDYGSAQVTQNPMENPLYDFQDGNTYDTVK